MLGAPQGTFPAVQSFGLVLLCLVAQTPTLVGLEGGDGVLVYAKVHRKKPASELLLLTFSTNKDFFLHQS